MKNLSAIVLSFTALLLLMASATFLTNGLPFFWVALPFCGAVVATVLASRIWTALEDIQA